MSEYLNVRAVSKDAAQGFAFGYFDGFLNIILKGFGDFIASSEDFGKKISARKFFILMPEDCFCPKSLSLADSRIEHVGHLGDRFVNRAGSVRRNYGRNSVYKFTQNDVEIYFVGEFATPLLNLHEMSKCGDVSMSPEELQSQMQTFLKTVKFLLSSNPAFRDQYEIIAVKDLATISDLIANRISQSEEPQLEETVAPVQSSPTHVGAGLAWSYYLGYLRIILPEFNKFVASSPEFGTKIRQKSLLIIVPEDCNCPGSFSEADERVQKAGHLGDRKIDRAGNVGRNYGRNTVYTITTNNEDVYFVADCPAVLLTMYAMANHYDLNVTSEDLRREVEEFIKTLRSLLENNDDCKGQYRIRIVKDMSKMADSVAEQ